MVENDIISRSEAIRNLMMQPKLTKSVVRRVLIQTQSADLESHRPNGLWVGEADGYADGELVFDVWYCDNCNYCIDDGTDDPKMLPNYCPNCGAKMEV